MCLSNYLPDIFQSMDLIIDRWYCLMTNRSKIDKTSKNNQVDPISFFLHLLRLYQTTKNRTNVCMIIVHSMFFFSSSSLSCSQKCSYCLYALYIKRFNIWHWMCGSPLDSLFPLFFVVSIRFLSQLLDINEKLCKDDHRGRRRKKDVENWYSNRFFPSFNKKISSTV